MIYFVCRRVVAPDLRGYGGSEKPPLVDDYHYKTLQKDVVELVDRKSVV